MDRRDRRNTYDRTEKPAPRDQHLVGEDHDGAGFTYTTFITGQNENVRHNREEEAIIGRHNDIGVAVGGKSDKRKGDNTSSVTEMSITGNDDGALSVPIHPARDLGPLRKSKSAGVFDAQHQGQNSQFPGIFQRDVSSRLLQNGVICFPSFVLRMLITYNRFAILP